MNIKLNNDLYYNNVNAVLSSKKTNDLHSRNEESMCDPLISTHLVLILNNFCQLRCVYCYSNTGGTIERKCMDIGVVSMMIERIFTNSYLMKLYGKIKKPFITIHGGGEPTLSWEIIENVYSISKKFSLKYDIPFNITIVTNGILNDKKISWIHNKEIKLQISLDGPKFVQDLYRPMIDGSSSFDRVINSLDLLKDKGIAIDIRITYYKDNQNSVLSFIKYICINYPNCQKILIGILHDGGRGDAVNDRININELISTIEIAKTFARKYNTEIIGPSETSFATGRGFICNAFKGKSLIVNYNNKILNCHERTECSDSIIGSYDGNLKIDDNKILRINSLMQSNNVKNTCNTCMGYSICGYGCPNRKDENYCEYIKVRMERMIHFYCENNRVTIPVDWSSIYDYYEENHV